MPVDLIDVKDAAGTTREVRTIPATQPVSAASLPLPSGAATETSLAAVLAKLSADPATQTTLAAILAKIIAAPATEAKQDSEITATEALAPVTLGASQDVAFDATAGGVQSTAITGTLIRVVAKDAACRIAIAADPTATATGTLIMAGQAEYFAITSGHKVAAIRDDATDGTLNITVAG